MQNFMMDKPRSMVCIVDQLLDEEAETFRTIQMDNAKPHTGKNNLDKLNTNLADDGGCEMEYIRITATK